MNQTGHGAIAAMAVNVLKQDGGAPELVGLLKEKLQTCLIGSWIPDLPYSKLGSGFTDNHIFKIFPYQPEPGKPDDSQYFVVSEKKLLDSLGSRAMVGFISGKLDKKWWDTPYKADPSPGKHLANRAMAVSIAIKDILIMGDEELAKKVPGEVNIGQPMELFHPAHAALFFFMLSHFSADCCMPCHCDHRDLFSSPPKGTPTMEKKTYLHCAMEEQWGDELGKEFTFDGLKGASVSTPRDPQTFLDAAGRAFQRVDIKLADFPNPIPDIKAKDIWSEMVTVCRGSFALANLMVPASDYGFPKRDAKGKMVDSEDPRITFDQAFSKPGRPSFPEITKVVLHDAVLNTAMLWKSIWRKFKEK